MKNVPKIVGLGETLWDVFPDGPRLGGAPLNFSCSAAELAGDSATVFMVSAVGNDALGRSAIDALKSHGVEIANIQRNDRATGQVYVELDAAGVASYRFADDGAWDHLEWTGQLDQLAAECDAVCFGSLGQRGSVSRDTIHKFVAATPATTMRILDVNLRAPFFSDEVILESLTLANTLKLNDDELPHLAKLFGIRGTATEIMSQLAEKYQLRCVALTRGSNGAVLMCGDAISDLAGVEVAVADTVGAGDAFTAAMTLGLLAGHSVDKINQHAINVAAYVCSQSGATVSFPDHLQTGT